jgi:hypothetical protein
MIAKKKKINLTRLSLELIIKDVRNISLFAESFVRQAEIKGKGQCL